MVTIVDAIKPEWLKVSIGEARTRIEIRIVESLKWQGLDETTTADETWTTFRRWYRHTLEDLTEIFVSAEVALAFCVSGASSPVTNDGPIHPDNRNHILAVHRQCSQEVIVTMRRLLDARMQIAESIADLLHEVASHGQVFASLRSVGADTKALSAKILREPLLASPLTRLMNNDIAVSTICEVVKTSLLRPS